MFEEKSGTEIKVSELEKRIRELETAVARMNVTIDILHRGALDSSQCPDGWRADEYDYKCAQASEFPGVGWEYVGSQCFPASGQVILIWRMSRKLQIELKTKPQVQVT